MRLSRVITVCLCICLALALPSRLHADDTAGSLVLRTEDGTELASGQGSDITIDIVDENGSPAMEGTVNLTNTETGEAFTVEVSNGVASAEGLSSGTWVVTSSSGLSVAAATVGVAGVVTGAVPALAGLVAVGGGATALGVAVSNNDSSSPVSPVE